MLSWVLDTRSCNSSLNKNKTLGLNAIYCLYHNGGEKRKFLPPSILWGFFFYQGLHIVLWSSQTPVNKEITCICYQRQQQQSRFWYIVKFSTFRNEFGKNKYTLHISTNIKRKIWSPVLNKSRTFGSLMFWRSWVCVYIMSGKKDISNDVIKSNCCCSPF